MSKTPRVSDIYRHFKGNLYQIVALAEHSETGEQMVVYQALYGDFRIYVRPLAMFLEPVDKGKYPKATQQMRFELIDRNELKREGVNSTLTKSEQTKQEQPKQDVETIREETSTESLYSDEVLSQVEPGVLRFLDADTHEQRLEILVSLASEITDHMLNTMAVAIDVELSEEKLEDKYEELKNCLITLEKYERNRPY